MKLPTGIGFSAGCACSFSVFDPGLGERRRERSFCGSHNREAH
jgi:hypothetical protein